MPQHTHQRQRRHPPSGSCPRREAPRGSARAIPAPPPSPPPPSPETPPGEPRTAFYLATWSAAQKIAAAFASFLGLTLISLFGFDATLEAGLSQAEGGNTNLALIGIVLLYTVIPSCFYLVTLPWIWSYSLTEERQSKIRERLERRQIARHDDLAGVNKASMKPIAGSLDHGISDAGGSE